MGGWVDPQNVAQMLSAVGAVHAARKQRGPYQEKCAECVALDREKKYMGCRFHRGAPAIWRRGNPTECDQVENCVKQNSQDGASYVPEGDSPLTPWELVDIRTFLLSSNDLFDLMLWVVTLVAVKLFLREDEYDGITGDSIVKDISIIGSDLLVEGLALRIQVYIIHQGIIVG
jgi:hypothetical protein